MSELPFVSVGEGAVLRDVAAAVLDDVDAQGGEWYTRYVVLCEEDGYRGMHLPALSAALQGEDGSLDTPLSQFDLQTCASIPKSEIGPDWLRAVREPLVVALEDGRPVALYQGRPSRGAVRSDRRGWWRLVGKWMAEQGTVPPWPDPLPDWLSYQSVLSIPAERTLSSVAGELQGQRDDVALAVPSSLGQWIVSTAAALLSRLTTEFPDAAPESMVGAFVDPDNAQMTFLAREETPWELVQEMFEKSRRETSRYVLTEAGSPVAILAQARTVRGTGDAGFSKSATPRSAAPSWNRFLQATMQMVPEASAQGRVVNAWFADQKGKNVAYTDALAANHAYQFKVSIGAVLEQAHVVGEQPELDAKLVSYLIGEGIPLVLRVDSTDFFVLDTEHEVSLPKGGSTPEVVFRVVTPVQTGEARLRLGVYYETNLVQSYLVVARVAPEQARMPEGAGDGWWSVCEYTLSSDLANLDDLSSRRVCLWIGEGREGSSRAGISGADGVDLGPALDINPALIQSALEHYRGLLYKTCFDPKSKEPEYLYNKDHTPVDKETFGARLIDLAELGQMLYERLFGTERGRQVAEALHQIEASQSEPLVVQIARLTLDTVFPWAVLYDRPLRYNPGKNVVCDRFLSEGTCGADCPHADDPNVVCPSGFWGFRYILEQPLRPPGAFSSIATRLASSGSPELALVFGPELGLAKKHGQEVKTVVGDRGTGTAYADTTSLLEAMRKGPELVYFYCHGGNTPFRQWLVVGEDDPLMPSYLGDDLRQVWTDGAPLVVLNGCHTGKYDPSTLLSFVHRLGAVGAAGVIGTEIPIHERLGDYFGRYLIDHLLNGESVGQIVYDFRWELLKQHNLLGLVYSPYCYADLRMGA